MKNESELQRSVLRELEWDARVDDANVGVTVRGGVVTLTGSTDSWAKRIAAQEAAHRVHGVLDVANEIQVTLPGRSRTDTDIAAAVRLALEWNVFVPHPLIHSTVSGGRVTLRGEVDALGQRDEAEKAVEHLDGVRQVINEIVVKPAKLVEPEEVRHAIQEALGRRAARESARVHVNADDGIVTLSGSCHTWADKKAVLGAARGTPGVRSVLDDLTIQP